MFENLPPLTLKAITSADNLPIVVEKTQFNFDQILLHGGGKIGKTGGDGKKGLPGATGIGEEGEMGEKGSEIFFTTTDQNDNDITISLEHREDDILIDGGGDYFKVFKDTFSNLRYSFKFNINTASTINPYWIDQKLYHLAPIQSNSIVNEHVLFGFGDPSGVEKNLVLSKRTDNGGGFDKSEYYRVLLGMDQYPAVPSLNATLFISNILHDNVQTADQQFFAQIGFKYRDSASANVGANTVWVIYKEESALNRYLFSIQNQSIGVFFSHDINNTDDSALIVKGANTKFIGQSVNIDIVTEWANLNIQVDIATFVTQKNLTVKSDSVIGSNSTFSIEFDIVNVKADTIFFSTLSPASDINWISSNNIIFTIDADFIMKSDKVALDTALIELGNTAGSTQTVVILNQNMKIDSNDKILDMNVDTGFFHKLRNKSVNMDTSAVLDVTNIDSPLVYLDKDGTGVITDIVGMDDYQVITFIVAVDSGNITFTGGNYDLRQNGDAILSNMESITLQYNPNEGVIEEIGGNYDIDKEGFQTITLLSSI